MGNDDLPVVTEIDVRHEFGLSATGKQSLLPLDPARKVHGYVSQDGARLYGWTMDGPLTDLCEVELRIVPVKHIGIPQRSLQDAKNQAAGLYRASTSKV